MTPKELAKLLRDASRQLSVLANEAEMMGSYQPRLPPKEQQMVDSGICIGCGEPIDKTEKPTRGLHFRCYRPVMAAIKSGKISEREAILKGLIDVQNITGRPVNKKQTAIQERIQEAIDRTEETAPQKRKSSK